MSPCCIRSAEKSSQSAIDDPAAGSSDKEQPESTPFTLKASNTTSPLENWNLTALSKPTPPTVKVFSPRVNAVTFPKKLPPLAVVLKTL